MAKRDVIEIDEEKCDGCGLCALGCQEGALRIIDGKARLVGENLCDGLGTCVGECPRGALTTVQREVKEYDERRVIELLLPKGAATLAAHLDHLKKLGQNTWHSQALAYLAEKGVAIPDIKSLDTRSLTLRPAAIKAAVPKPEGLSGGNSRGMASKLEQWPIQLHLINPRAPFFSGADLLIAADCTAFACGAFHPALLAGRKLLIACPKLDQGKEKYIEKIRALIDDSKVRSVNIAIMDIPCCGGLKRLVDEAASLASRSVSVATVVVSAEGGSLNWL